MRLVAQCSTPGRFSSSPSRRDAEETAWAMNPSDSICGGRDLSSRIADSVARSPRVDSLTAMEVASRRLSTIYQADLERAEALEQNAREGDSGPSIALSKRLERFMRRKTRASSRIAPRFPLHLLLVTTLLPAMPAMAQSAGPADLQMHSLDGRPFSLDSLKGSVVVLDFWASWCVPCRTSFSVLRRPSEPLRKAGRPGPRADARGQRRSRHRVPRRRCPSRSRSPGTRPAAPARRSTSSRCRRRSCSTPTGRVAARFEGGDPRRTRSSRPPSRTLLAGKHPRRRQ